MVSGFERIQIHQKDAFGNFFYVISHLPIFMK